MPFSKKFWEMITPEIRKEAKEIPYYAALGYWAENCGTGTLESFSGVFDFEKDDDDDWDDEAPPQSIIDNQIKRILVSLLGVALDGRGLVATPLSSERQPKSIDFLISLGFEKVFEFSNHKYDDKGGCFILALTITGKDIQRANK